MLMNTGNPDSFYCKNDETNAGSLAKIHIQTGQTIKHKPKTTPPTPLENGNSVYNKRLGALPRFAADVSSERWSSIAREGFQR